MLLFHYIIVYYNLMKYLVINANVPHIKYSCILEYESQLHGEYTVFNRTNNSRTDVSL